MAGNEKIIVELLLKDKDFQEGIKKAAKGTDKLSKDGTKGFGNMNSAIKAVGGALVAAFTVDKIIDFTKQVIATTAEFQKLKATLKTTLGSGSQAELAFQQIQKFAAKTPFQVNELTEAYLRLAQRGIKSTNEQLTALGDFAASSGKGVMQLVEAMLDVNNAERWKEFGVKVSTSGDLVKGSARGMTMEFERTTEGAMKLVEALGRMDGVAGGMAEVSDTLGGKISNLEDSWDSFLYTVGEGNNTIFQDTIDVLGKVINKLTEWLKTAKMIKAEKMGDEAAKIKAELGELGDEESYNNAINKLNKELEDAKIKAEQASQAWANYKNENNKLEEVFDDLKASITGAESEEEKLNNAWIESAGTVMAYQTVIDELVTSKDQLSKKTKELSQAEIDALEKLEKKANKQALEFFKPEDEPDVAKPSILVNAEVNQAGMDAMVSAFEELNDELGTTETIQRNINQGIENNIESANQWSAVLIAGNDIAIDMASSLIDGLFDAIAAGEDFGEVMSQVIKKMLFDMTKLIIKTTILSALFPGLGFGFGLGIGRNASGTNMFGGGLTLVGEYGPELVSLPGGSSIASASKTAGMMGGGELYSKISGEDIYLSSKRYAVNRQR